MNAGRFLRTVRYFRVKQAAFFVYRRVLQRTTTRIRTPSTVDRRSGVGLRPRPSLSPGGTGDFGFVFLGAQRTFGRGAVDWHCADVPRLWRYNLHYFDYLLDENRSIDARDHLIDDWIARNPPGAADAWEPYTVSLRIVNWIDYVLRTEDKRPPKDAWLASLYGQAAWLERHIEYHILANHYLKNAVALIFAGAFFAGKRADRWLDLGAKILSAEVREQILADGGHFERSPLYHGIVTQDLVDVVNILSASRLDARVAGLDLLRDKAAKALEFLFDILHPDGEIPLFNDAAIGIALDPAVLSTYAREVLGPRPIPASEDGTVIAKAESGYYGCRKDGDFLLIDCGPVGPDYQPGHAHCDTLSFELSLDGRRVIVDSGVRGYEMDALRAYVRSTEAHNTVKVNGVEQSEIWGAFRVGRRARPLMARVERLGDDEVAFTGAHDGYRHLGQKVIHERHVRCRPASGVYEFEDRLTGDGEAAAESYLHLHPELRVEAVDGRYRVAGSDGRPVMDIVPGDMSESETRTGVYCPRFGVGLENTVVALKKRGRLPFKISFSLIKIAS
jgi:uncharacterized heparinase superfamily protein